MTNVVGCSIEIIRHNPQLIKPFVYFSLHKEDMYLSEDTHMSKGITYVRREEKVLEERDSISRFWT